MAALVRTKSSTPSALSMGLAEAEKCARSTNIWRAAIFCFGHEVRNAHAVSKSNIQNEEESRCPTRTLEAEPSDAALVG
jgi:hypothetical protein